MGLGIHGFRDLGVGSLDGFGDLGVERFSLRARRFGVQGLGVVFESISGF